ncbi:MGH1-like glycoside hydrolase domain-containing protein [Salana multivorans]
MLDFVDLDSVPFTVNGSRYVLRRTAHGIVGLYYVRYEVQLADCLVEELEEPSWFEVHPGHVVTDRWTVAILGDEVRASSPTAADPGFLEAADAVMSAWMALRPAVLPERRAMAEQCWWVLGSNQVNLRLPDGREIAAVVPSKIGYVGLWQWDAYFIALGLRHGAPGLAAQQIDGVLTPAPDGQLPDVVHENGILASSADLPATDVVTLRAKSRTDTDHVVPLTKPPLAAWAAEGVTQHLPPGEAARWWERWLPIIRGSQAWWLRYRPDGPPRYEHPYSSGLDDSPVFDDGGVVVSPDLLAYLVRQQEILDRRAGGADATATTLRAQLEELWDESSTTYLPQHLDRQAIHHRTVLSLLALFAGDLPADRAAALVADLEEPSRFAAPRGRCRRWRSTTRRSTQRRCGADPPGRTRAIWWPRGSSGAGTRPRPAGCGPRRSTD